MLRAVARDSVIYGGAWLLVRGLSLLLLPFYTRVLTPEDYGLVDLATVFSTLVLLTVALEIMQAVGRLFHEAADHDSRVAYASTALWFSVGAYALFVVVAFPLAPQIAAIAFDSSERADLSRIVVVTAAVSGVFHLLLNQLRWRLQPMAYAAGSVAFALVSIAATVTLVLGARLGVPGVLLGQLCGAVVGGVICFLASRDLYRLRFDRGRLHEMLAFSLPLVPSSMGLFVTLYIDRIAIKELMTVADVGLFGVGYRVASVVSLLVMGVGMALTPVIYARYRDPGAPEGLARTFRYFVASALLLGLVLAVFAPEIVSLVAAAEFHAGAAVVPLLAPALLLSAMNAFAPGLSIAKRTGTLAAITIAGGVLNTVLTFVMIPVWGIVGAAAATLVTAAVVFGIYMAVSQRLYWVPHRWDRLAAATLGVALLGVLGVWLDLPPATAILVKVGLALVALLVVTALRLVDPADVRRAFSAVRRRALIQ